MTVESCIFKTGATAITMTGGTDMTFSETGLSVPSGLNVANLAQVDFRIRQNISWKTRDPRKVGLEWLKAKRSAVLLVPKLLASGDLAYNLVRQDIEFHPESTAAEILELRMLGAQLMSTAESLNFVVAGTLR